MVQTTLNNTQNCAMVVSLVTQMQATSPASDPLMTLSQQVQWMSTATLQQMEAGITMARVSRTRQDEVTRLQFRVLDETVRSALRAGLRITGARHMVGTAPPNHHDVVHLSVNTRPVLGKEFGPFSLPSADLVPLSL